MKKGRPQTDLEEKMHQGIRSRVKYTGKGTFVSISSGAVEKARANRPRHGGKKVTAEEWDAWWCKQVNKGEYKVPATGKDGTAAERELGEMRRGTAQQAHEVFVHEWARQRGREGKGGTPHLTPGQLETMVRTRAGKGTSRAAIYAAVLAASARWGWRIQHSGMGPGAKHITPAQWMQGIGDEAVQKGWYKREAIDQIIANAHVETTAVNRIPPPLITHWAEAAKEMLGR